MPPQRLLSFEWKVLNGLSKKNSGDEAKKLLIAKA